LELLFQLNRSNLPNKWNLNGYSPSPCSVAAFETDAKRADLLRSFGLVRLPKNIAVCTRAGEVLLAQHSPEMALAAVDRVLLTDPAAVPAQSLRLRVLEAMAR
jgi:hypothetical protein